MSDAVLPGGEFLPVIRKSVHDEFTYSRQCEAFSRGLQDRHGNQSDV